MTPKPFMPKVLISLGSVYCSACIVCSCDKEVAASDTKNILDDASVDNECIFSELLNSLRIRYNYPALAEAIVFDASVTHVGEVWSRRYGGPENVTINDQLYIGNLGYAIASEIVDELTGCTCEEFIAAPTPIGVKAPMEAVVEQLVDFRLNTK